ncbi:DnaD domain protein [Lentibacillus sp. N15]|uniref:DnaD domain-containing protein n=1 Tax=Lentibacillus songyuanensis TaxID=3136161 RepID=UPI0031BADD1E
MNYIKEMNAFYDHMERKPLSASAINLWYALMHINNKAMWAKTFTASATVLRYKTGLKESSFKRARAELKACGYIDYVSRPRNQAPIYRMISLVEGINGTDERAWTFEYQENLQCDDDTEDLPDQSMYTGLEHRNGQEGMYARVNRLTDLHADNLSDERVEDKQINERGTDHLMDQPANQHKERDMDQATGQNAGTLMKHEQDTNRIIQNEISAAAEVFVFYQQNFGVIRPFMTGEIIHWVEAIGEPLVLEAMKRAVKSDRIMWSYVKGILLNWQQKGIASLDDAQAEEVAFQNQRREQMHRVAGAQSGVRRTEVVPEWFDDHKRRQKIEKAKKEKVLEKVETKEEIAEFDALLAEFVEEGVRV